MKTSFGYAVSGVLMTLTSTCGSALADTNSLNGLRYDAAYLDDLSLGALAENCGQLRASFESLSLKDPMFTENEIQHIQGFMNSLRSIGRRGADYDDASAEEAQKACYMPGSTVDPKYPLYEIAQECQEYQVVIRETDDPEVRKKAIQELVKSSLSLEEIAQTTIVPATVTYACNLNL